MNKLKVCFGKIDLQSIRLEKNYDLVAFYWQEIQQLFI